MCSGFNIKTLRAAKNCMRLSDSNGSGGNFCLTADRNISSNKNSLSSHTNLKSTSYRTQQMMSNIVYKLLIPLHYHICFVFMYIFIVLKFMYKNLCMFILYLFILEIYCTYINQSRRFFCGCNISLDELHCY